MRALVATGPGELVLDEVEAPAIGPHQVLVRTRVSAVSSGTERRMLYGRPGDPLSEHPGWPAIGAFGYLAAGDVVEVGAEVRGLAVGDRVSCGRAWGAHRELVDVDAVSATVLPDGMSYLEGACSYWAVPPLCGILAGEIRLGDDVAVVGLGPLGLAAVQLLAGLCRRVVGIDRVAARCEAAREYGAVAVDTGSGDSDPADVVHEALAEVVPDGPRVVLEVSGTQSGFELALDIVRPLGRVVLVGALPPLEGVDLFWPMQIKGVSVHPLHRPSAANPEGGGADSPRSVYLPEVLELITAGRLDIAGLCTSVVPVAEAPEAMRLLHTRPDRMSGLAFAWY